MESLLTLISHYDCEFVIRAVGKEITFRVLRDIHSPAIDPWGGAPRTSAQILDAFIDSRVKLLLSQLGN